MFIITFIVGVIGFIVRGFTIVSLWSWFAAPFVGFDVTFWQAIGLTLLLSIFWTPGLADINAWKEVDKDSAYRLTLTIGYLIMYSVTWSFGWIVSTLI